MFFLQPSRTYLAFECFLLAIALPTAILASGLVRSALYAVLWGIAALCLWRLLKDPSFDRRSLWNFRALTRPAVWEVARLWVVLACAILLFTWWYDPARMFSLPRNRPDRWVLVMVLYPILSVYPQELIYRAFFFHRYRPIFGQGRGMVLLSAAVFGYAHIMMQNWVAVVFSAAGGLLFGYSYLRHRSLALTSLEHALYGNLVFTAGLGWYFYHAAMR